jgi:hypothetical protein
MDQTMFYTTKNILTKDILFLERFSITIYLLV